MTSTNNRIAEDDICHTLMARMGTGGNQVHAILEQEVTCYDMDNERRRGPDEFKDMSPALTARMGTGGNNTPMIMEQMETQNLIVRRLTPLTCERLQGFPDKWTDIGEWTDDKGKKHKPSDAPRYKSLGNSIGLPFWFWLTKRISAEYPDRKPTMTSLFAGIGGFDLCWHWVNGDGTVPTVAEIEPFPCAVLEKHFGENGDWKNYEKPEWYKKYESNAE